MAEVLVKFVTVYNKISIKLANMILSNRPKKCVTVVFRIKDVQKSMSLKSTSDYCMDTNYHFGLNI